MSGPEIIFSTLARQFRRREAEARLYRTRLVGEGLLPKGRTGPLGRVELDLNQLALLTLGMAASATALHAPEAARRYLSLIGRAELLEGEPPSDAAPIRTLPDALAEVRDSEHSFLELISRLLAAHSTKQGRRELAGIHLRLLVSRDFPHAELTVSNWRSGARFRVTYPGKFTGELHELASMPDHDADSGVSYPAVLDSRAFAALGAAMEEFEKEAAAEPRPDRRKQVGRQSAANNPRGEKNNPASQSGQPSADLRAPSPILKLERAECRRPSAFPTPPDG